MIEYTSQMVSTTFAYIGLIFSDLSNLLLIIVSIGLALIVFEAIIWAIKKH